MPLPNHSSQHVQNHGQKRKRKQERSSGDATNGITFNFKDQGFRRDVGAKSDASSRPSSQKQVNGAPKKQQDGARQNSKASQDSPLPAWRIKIFEESRRLPIFEHITEIRMSLRGTNDVLILHGETGSGKSTQVPQYLRNEPWCTGRVGITQPRRVAAISLARRVAAQMDTTLGNASPASQVGYSVRFDHNVAPATKIKFLTDGMLLQELLRDPWLKEYSVVIVDEVHERGVNVDLVLGFLRRILTLQSRHETNARKGKGRLKVVVMSATADLDAFYEFFRRGFKEMEDCWLREEMERRSHLGPGGRVLNGPIAKPGQTPPLDPVQGLSYSMKERLGKALELKYGTGANPRRQSPPAVQYKGHLSEDSWEGCSSEDEANDNNGPKSPLTNGSQGYDDDEENTDQEDPLSWSKGAEYINHIEIEGRQHTVSVYHTVEPQNDFVEAALNRILEVNHKEPLPGDILVFLTGQDTVEALEKIVNAAAEHLGPEVPKLQVLPLFAAMPQHLQARIFESSPIKTRKVIISTNIAETSLTIPGIVHVVDSGLAKIKEHRPSTGLALSSLLVKPISKSSALQRAGRAGREGPGKCWRLYPKDAFEKLEEDMSPEILRSDVADAVLTMRARGIEDPLTFPLIDRPPAEEVRRAILALYRLGALEPNGTISPDGKKMSRLPLPPNMGRVLVTAGGAPGNSLDDHDRPMIKDVIDIVAALSVESLFLPLQDEAQKEEAASSRRELLRRDGDHLTYLSAVRSYASENSDRKTWCERRFVSHRAMRNVMDVRKQLRAQAVQQKLLGQGEADARDEDVPVGPERAERILKCFLRGFQGNVASLMRDGSYRTVEGNQTVAIHPGSVLFGRKVEAVLFNELVFTSKCYARGVSAVQMRWWADVVGAEVS